LKVLAVLFSAQPSWGFSVREPNVSATQPSLELPPPTTVLGALSYGMAKTLGLNYETFLVEKHGKSKRSKGDPSVMLTTLPQLLSEAMVYAGATVETYSPYNDINRHVTRIYQREERKDDPKYKFGAVQVGKVYVTGLVKGLVAFDADKLEEVLRDLKALVPSAGWNKSLEDLLVESAYRITRIGTKEGIIAVEYAKAGEARKVNDVKFNSSFYQPEKAIDLTKQDPFSQDVDIPQKYRFCLWSWRVLRAWSGGFVGKGSPVTYVYRVCDSGYLGPIRATYWIKQGCSAYEFEGEGFAVC
jgi:CRISPR-associated protein Cas5 subtype I-A